MRFELPNHRYDRLTAPGTPLHLFIRAGLLWPGDGCSLRISFAFERMFGRTPDMKTLPDALVEYVHTLVREFRSKERNYDAPCLLYDMGIDSVGAMQVRAAIVE